MRFGISKSSVSRWTKRLEPCLTRKKPATKIYPERLIRDVEQHQDERTEERVWMQSARHMRGVEAVEYQQGEKLFSIRKLTMESRRTFKKKISVYELIRIPLIYINESGFSENMPRIFGYAPSGVRCFGKHGVMSKRRTNVVGALSEDKMLTTAFFDGTVNTDVFEAWLQQGLLPVLQNGAVVVMDNASFHKSGRIKEAVEAAGCLLKYLSPYSPDLNPIEHKWAQAKALRIKLGCVRKTLSFSRSIENLTAYFFGFIYNYNKDRTYAVGSATR